MIDIVLSLVGGASYDVTSRLDEEGGVKIGVVEKPSAVDLFMDDVRLVLHDEDRFLRGLFIGAPPSAKWRVDISEDGRMIFRGEIQNDENNYHAAEEIVEFDTFSLEKVFWEIAQKTKIRPRRNPGESDQTYVTLQYLFERELGSMFRDENPFETLFDGFDLGVFASDQVRFSKARIYRTTGLTTYGSDYVQEAGSPNFTAAGLTAATAIGALVTAYYIFAADQNAAPLALTGRVVGVDDTTDRIYVDRWTAFPYTGHVIPTNGLGASVGIHPSIGLDGRYTRLHRETTVAELLEAVMAEKNAQIFIDYDTRKLTMRERGAITSDRATTEGLSIDPVLLDDPQPVITVLDEEVYDYVRLHTGAPVPPQLRFTRFEEGQSPGIFGYAVFGYVMTLVFESGYETNPSDELEVFIEGSNPFTRKGVVLALDPSGYPGVVRRRIYRTDFRDPQRLFRLLATVEGDALASYTDVTVNIYTPNDPFLIANTLYPPDESRSVGVWIRFDAATSTWDTPIIDLMDGNGAPEGRIFEDTYQPLRFLESDSSKDVDDQEYQQVRFFGSEVFSTIHMDRWKRYFLPSRRVEAGLEGRGYRVGDSIIAGHKLFDGDSADDRLVFRRGMIDLVADETMATLVSR